MRTTCYHPSRALRDEPDTPGQAVEERPDTGETPKASEPGTGSVLVCKLCRVRITRRDLAMQVDGSHTHVFFNPQGQVFELGCFAAARNVLAAGPMTDEFTWFPGYKWQAVVCSGCNAHLGWRYMGDASGFYGLILAALTEETTGKPT